MEFIMPQLEVTSRHFVLEKEKPLIEDFRLGGSDSGASPMVTKGTRDQGQNWRPSTKGLSQSEIANM